MNAPRSEERWSPEELAELKRLYTDQKYEIDEITELLGRSENSVRVKASRLGLKRPITELGIHLTDGSLSGINYDPISNTMTIYKPVDIQEVLKRILQIQRDWGI